MLAILVMMGTSLVRPGMLAISMTKGTKHACHLSFVKDKVCLPSFLIGTRYACHIFKIENPFPIKHVHFRSNLIGGNLRSLQAVSQDAFT